jgi:hypothetical protein
MRQRTPEQIVGKERLLQLIFEGYEVKPMTELKWHLCEDETDLPKDPGWYRVMVSGDSESIDGHEIYSFDDYETWAQFRPYDDGGGSFSGIHDEDEHCIFAWYGPITFPAYGTR